MGGSGSFLRLSERSPARSRPALGSRLVRATSSFQLAVWGVRSRVTVLVTVLVTNEAREL